MAESVLTTLLQQLSSLAYDEFLLVWTSKTELEKLHHTIAFITDIVQDAEQKRASDPKIARWLSRLRVEIYNVDDFFDAISARILQKKAISGNKLLKEVRLFFSKSNNHLGLLVSTARKVKQIRGRLDDLAKDINDFGLLSTSHTEAPKPVTIRREEHSYVKADDIIGREKEKESLLNMLIADADADDGVPILPVSTITVVGMGGLGKTALAQLVFNEKHVQEHFELCLWACVNDFSNLNLVLEKIVASGNMDRCEGLQLEQLQRMLRDMIGDKKYFLVLDDVWDDDLENWRRLKHLLDVGKNRSKILVTTRLKIIAQNLSPVGHLYLQGLSDEDAWFLFKKVAFDPSQSERIERLEKIGRGIVKKCANVPLAVRIMGSFLHNKDESRWLYALNNEISQGHDKIMEVLKISYNDLPWSLKHCFAYCSLFPKDYEFRKDQLINIWMAQGFLESADHKRNLEDIGHDCFSSLVERCFFQDVKTDGYGNIVSCKMHDLLHDLAVDVAGKECFMVKSNMNGFTESCRRHLSYACYAKFSEENLLPFSQMEGLRTLLFHRGKDINFSFLDGQIFRLRCLRALDLSWLSMKELPRSIGMLVHLRYLDLSGNKKLIKLPASICKLQNLLTLKLNWCRSLKELPSDFKLLCLRHLELDTCDELARMPPGLKEMTCLVTLSKFVVDKKSGGLRHLKLLNNLRGDLTIQLPGGGWENCVVDAKESMLKSKTKLRRLNIQWSDPKEGPVFSESEAVLDHLQPPSNLRSLQVKRFPGRRISDWVASLEHLIELEISYCLSCVQLPPLRQLKDLKILELSQLPLVEYMENDICSDDIRSFFSSLETLDIDGMEKLKGWWSQEGVDTQNSAIRELAWFRRVSKVTVWNCPNLTDLPSFPYVVELGLRRVHGNLFKNTAVITSNWCRLKGLHIYQIEGSVFLPDDWAEAFSTLQTLYIERCSKLQPLSQHLIRHLAALETLVVTECEEFNLVNDENGMESQVLLPRLKWLRLGLNRTRLLNGLHCLSALERLEIRFGNLSDREDSMPLKLILPPNIRRLSIEKMKKQQLSYFSEAFHKLSKLEVLEFYYCEMDERELNGIPWEALKELVQLTLYSMRNMEALPEECRRLYSLQRLELNIGFCDGFKSLPDWITRIKQLRIKECGQVSEKYKNLTGPCWPQISHIPDVQVS